MSEISEAARQLKALREQAGLSMRVVADSLGWRLTKYQHYEDRYRRRFLPIELARHLADLFAPHGVNPAEVMELAGVGLDRSLPGSGVIIRGDAGPQPTAPRDLPIMGAVRGGSTGFYFNDGDPKEYVERPASLAGSTNAFALYVDGDSMEPRYFAGEVLFVNPNRPLTKNCFVAVELTDGRGLIKQFLRRNDDQVVLHQFNPARDIKLSAKDIKNIYRIIAAGEAG
jgi:SOS-response transcriptional repressor LexA